MGANCYATTNLLTGLAAGSFSTYNIASGATDVVYLNDSRMDKVTIGGNYLSPPHVLTITIDLGSAMQVTGVAMLNHNLATQDTGVTVIVEGATNAAISTGVVTAKNYTTLNSTAPKNKDHVLQFAAVTKRYWRIQWVTSMPITAAGFGELWFFNNQTQLSRKSIYGGGETEEIKTASVDFDNGGRRAYFQGGPIRSVQLPYADLTAAQREELAIMWRATKGEATPFLWIPSYEATSTAAAAAEQEVIYGRLQVADFVWKENDYLLYQPQELVIRSLGRQIGS